MLTMGYELMGTHEEVCPCGKSKKITTSYMDDWNRTKSTYEMVCDTCRNEYIQQENYWVKKEDWQKKEMAEKKYKNKKLIVENISTDELAEEWYQYFSHIKTKKALYSNLVENWNWSLGVDGYSRAPYSRTRFNEEVVRKSIEESIRHLFKVMLDYTNVHQVADKISSENKKILSDLKTLDKLLVEKRAAEREMNSKLH